MNENSLTKIRNVVEAFISNYDKNEFDYKLSKQDIQLAEYKNNMVLKFDRKVLFESFNMFILFLENSSPQAKLYNVKGIYLGTNGNRESFYLIYNPDLELKLIGRNQANRKLYVELEKDLNNKAIVFLNRDIDYLPNINYKKYSREFNMLNFLNL